MKISIIGIGLLAFGFYSLVAPTSNLNKIESYVFILAGLFFAVYGDKETLLRIFTQYKSSVIGALAFAGYWYLVSNKITDTVSATPLLIIGCIGLGLKDALPFFNKNNQQNGN
jgi:hypothetical protein